jgi:uncharacterized iron-regulated membrane protein
MFRRPSPPGRQADPVEEGVKIAQDLYPGAPVAGFGLPAGPRGVYRVSMKTEGSTVPVSQAIVLIDPRSGKVLRDTGAASTERGIETSASPIRCGRCGIIPPPQVFTMRFNRRRLQ